MYFGNKKEKEQEKTERKRGARSGEEENAEKSQVSGKTACLIKKSSVEVGYGFYTIRSKLLIANDMYWVVL